MIENNSEKILVIRFSSMGDVILTASLFSTLKNRFPDCAITFITDSQYVELFSDDPRLSSVIGISRGQKSFESALMEQRWDLVVDLQNNRRSKKLVNLLNNKGRVGIFRKPYLKRMLLLLARVGLYSEQDCVALRYNRAAGINLKITELESCRLFFKSPIPQHVQSLIRSGEIVRPTIALIPFAAWKNKMWPREYTVNVGKFFIAKGWDVCILGGPSEREQGETLAEMIGPKCTSLAGKLTLYECGCFFKKCSLALGNDTGLSHLARACGVRTGVLFGPTTKHWGFYPFGEPPFKIFESDLFCRPCHAHGGNICFFNQACLKRVSPEQVIKGLMELMRVGE